jgi:hypothetical protein
MARTLRLIALFGAVAVMITGTMVLTLSRATLSASGIGSVKCYDVTGAIQKTCSDADQLPVKVRTSAVHTPLN